MDPLERINNSLQRLTNKFIYFTRLVCKLTIEESKLVPTMGANGEYLYILYNKDFVDNITDEILDFVVMHELMHIVNRHDQRFIKDRSHDVNNITMDLEINSVIVNKIKFGSKLEDGVYPDQFNLPELKTHEWYMDHMPKDLDKMISNLNGVTISISLPNDSATGSSQGSGNGNEGKVEGEGSGGGSGVKSDQSSEPKNSITRINDKVLSKEDIENSIGNKLDENSIPKIDKIVADIRGRLELPPIPRSNNKVNKVSTGYSGGGDNIGNDPDISTGDGSMIYTRHYSKIIKYFDFYELIKKLTKSQAIYKNDYTYSRMNRRKQDDFYVSPGIYGYKKEEYSIGLILDVSASMDEVTSKIQSSLRSFYNKYKSRLKLDIDVFICDTICKDPIPLEKFVKNRNEYYGGGTYLFTAFEKVATSKKNYKNILIVTDCYDDFSEFKKYNKKCMLCIPESLYDKYSIELIKSYKNNNLIPIVLRKL